MLEVDIRPDLGFLIARIALLDLRSTLSELCGERLGNALLYEQSSASKAHLAGVVVLLDRELNSEIEIGVVEDHCRALAAEFE